MHRSGSGTATAVIFVLAALAATATASAQEARSGGGSPNAALVQQLQQLASERTDLQAQTVKLQKDLDDMRKERDALKAAREIAEKRAQTSESAIRQAQAGIAASKDASSKEIARWRQQTDELVAKYRELAATLQGVERDRDSLKQTLATQDQSIEMCAQRNVALYDISVEVLNRLGHPPMWSTLARTEPFTRITRTRLDNLVVEYRQRVDAQRQPRSSAAP
jgi:hypothetical protein